MAKKSKSKKNVPQVDPFLEGMLAKLLDRLTGLERKMDQVLSRSSAPSHSHQHQEAPQPPRPSRIMFEAICASCNKVCEVPFKPTEGRAIYCKPCFAMRKSGGGGVNNMPRPVQTYKPNPAAVNELPKQPHKPAKPAKKPAAKKSKKKR